MKVQSIDRVFDILEEISKEPEGLNLTEISHKLNLPTSTVFRLVSVLRKRNYTEKNDITNRYRLGHGLIELTSSYLRGLELKTEAQPFLRKLSISTGHVVFMAIKQEEEVVYIDRFEQFNDHRKYCIIGTRMPLYCTGLGKSFLMAYKDEEIRELYTRQKMTALTKHTITDIDELIENIHECRSKGYSEDLEENTYGINCVAAPIYDYRGSTIAAISISWEINAVDHSVNEKNSKLVRETAYNISIQMGWTKPISV